MSKDWTRLVITEQGGFAGVLRGAELLSHSLEDAQRAHVSQCLAALQELPAPGRQVSPPGHADQQTIHLECHQEAQSWQASFDRANLPAAVSSLLESVRLKPMPPR